MADSSNIFMWLIKTCGKVILKPSEFFGSLSERKPEYWPAYVFSFLLIFISVIIAVSVDIFLVSSGYFANSKLSELSLSTIIGIMAVSSISVFVIAGLLHLCVIMAGSSGSIKNTFLVTAYSSAAYIFFVIPVLGGLLSNIIWMILILVGLRKLHDMSISRAIASILAFMVIPVIIGIIFFK